MSKTEKQLADEFKATHLSATSEHQEVDPTEEELKNGWTKETLNAYLIEQTASQALRADPKSVSRRLARRPVEQNHRYRPLRWR